MSFQKLTMNADELNQIYHYGENVHKNYFFFKVSTDPFLSDLLLVYKTPNNKNATIQDLINTMKCRFGDQHQYVGYSKTVGGNTHYLVDLPKDMPLLEFAFLNLNPDNILKNPEGTAERIDEGTANSIAQYSNHSDHRIYNLKLDLNKPMGPIVLEPARPAGEPIGPLEVIR
jgi:hypothetical protein